MGAFMPTILRVALGRSWQVLAGLDNHMTSAFYFLMLLIE
jgi:hypothetical protein